MPPVVEEIAGEAQCIPHDVATGEIDLESREEIAGRVVSVQRTPHRRFPLKTSGWKNWVQKLLEVVKTPNQRPKIQLLEQGDLFWQSNHPDRVLRKSTNVSYLAAKAPMKERGGLFPVVCQCLLNA